MFIINPDRFLSPAYRISPFATSDIGKNHGLNNCSSIDDYFKSRFRGFRFNYTTNGKQAINIALKSLQTV